MGDDFSVKNLILRALYVIVDKGRV